MLRKLTIGLLFFLLLALPLVAQAAHSVSLTWVDGKNPAGVTYNVYRATGLCSGTPTFSKLSSGITALTYTDLTVVPGSYCYQVTAVLNGIESSPSNSVNPIVGPYAPSTLSVVVQ